MIGVRAMRTRWRPHTIVNTAIAFILAGCTPAAQPQPAEAPGTVELNQGPPNDVLLGGGGTGTVDFRGTIYHFAIGGLGVQGSAVAVLRTTGEVYRLQDIARFAGTYRRTSDTPVIKGQSAGGLWLENEHATIMHLGVPPGGRMPDIGNDALRVDLDR
jgi:hypothetical protein